MVFAYKHIDGRVVLTSMPSRATLTLKPFCGEVLKEMERLPGMGERFNPQTLKIEPIPNCDPPFDAHSEIEALKTRLAILECRI